MVNSVTNALNAYQAALSRINNTPATKETLQTNSTQNSFGQVLQNVIEDTIETQKHAEITTINGISGKADIQDVVLAISNAEQALETVVAVRDTAIKAYNSIMQMNI